MSKPLLCFVILVVCQALPALSGFGVSPVTVLDTVPPQVSLLSPNGGEEWYVGDSHDILWSASDSHPITNPVCIMYSLNGGVSWTTQSSGTLNDGSYLWELPLQQSYAAKVQIKFTDAFGHVEQDISALPFSITLAPPLAPSGIAISLLNNYDALIDWSPVTQTIYGSPVTPDGYLLFMSPSPGAEDDYVFLWYVTENTQFTHTNVARFQPHVFYYVLAYKDFGGRVQELLTEAENGRSLTLGEFRRELQTTLGGAQ